MNEQQAEMVQFRRDIDYAETHHEELLNQYPEKWIAILSQRVVGSGTDVYDLIDELGARGVPTDRVVLRHLTRQEELLIL